MGVGRLRAEICDDQVLFQGDGGRDHLPVNGSQGIALHGPIVDRPKFLENLLLAGGVIGIHSELGFYATDFNRRLDALIEQPNDLSVDLVDFIP